MKLIIDLIDVDAAGIMDSVIFVVGFFVTVTFVLFKMFSKEEKEVESQDYYSRHHLPLKNKEEDKIY